jgi:formyltetrahydrofolate deformylase
MADLSSSAAARLLIQCPDRAGIVAAVSTFLSGTGANIVSSDQFTTDPENGEFFMRLTFVWPEGASARFVFEEGFGEVAERFGMRWRTTWPGDRKRVVLMVSRMDHCLADLLWRYHHGELEMNIAAVISNHEDSRASVEALGVPYHHIPVTRDTKPEAEARQLEVIRPDTDLVVLARYMQILSGEFLDTVGCPVIDIHHSFLPAFAGAGPYERAHARGVKLIGATAHYATVDLDEGPIIAQGVLEVSHRDSVEDLIRVGRDVERVTLARAVRSHLEDRVVVHEGRTMLL